MTAPSVSSTTRIGWIGTGVMGLPMCGHVLAKGWHVAVCSRTKSRAQPLLDKGAAWVDSPATLARRSDVVFTMVGLPADVREVYFGSNGLMTGVRPNSILVDMTTTEPTLSHQIYDAARAKDAHAVDAPVSGGDVGAQNATLSIMAGGDEATVNAVRPILEVMGKKIVRQGGPGAGQHAKMCNQIVIAGTLIGVCECLLYGYKAGLDLNTMLDSIRDGAARCWALDNLAPRILKRNFEPGFLVRHFVKDMSIALDEARHMGLALPGLALVHQLYLAVQAQGHDRCGVQALMLALEQMSKTELR